MLGIIFLSSCKKEEIKKDEIKLSSSSVTLRHGQKYQIEATSLSTISYTSTDDFYATVSSTGLVTANHIGSTPIILKNEEDETEFIVSIVPLYYTYDEPKIKIGDSKESVLGVLGNPDNDSGDSFAYIDFSNNCGLMILFDNNKVSSYAVMVPTKYMSELTDFLIERYSVIGISGGDAYYINHDRDMGIVESVYNTSYIMVMYIPYSEKGMSVDVCREYERLFQM